MPLTIAMAAMAVVAGAIMEGMITEEGRTLAVVILEEEILGVISLTSM
jgi:hypothetical protein